MGRVARVRGLVGILQAAVAVAIAFPALATPAPPDDRYDALIRDAIAEAGGSHRPPLALVKAVIRQESSFRPRAVSSAGARGLMQVMPATARRVGVRAEDLFDPAQNIRAGVRLLSVLLDHYHGDVISALVAYNARPRKLFAPIPRNGETPRYVWAVLAYYQWYSRSGQRVGSAGARAGHPGIGGSGGLHEDIARRSSVTDAPT